MNYIFKAAPGSGPVTSNNIFGFRTDILLQLLNIKARRAYPTNNVSDIVPMLLKHLYETMEKNDTSVSIDICSVWKKNIHRTITISEKIFFGL